MIQKSPLMDKIAPMDGATVALGIFSVKVFGCMHKYKIVLISTTFTFAVSNVFCCYVTTVVATIWKYTCKQLHTNSNCSCKKKVFKTKFLSFFWKIIIVLIRVPTIFIVITSNVLIKITTYNIILFIIVHHLIRSNQTTYEWTQ